MILLQIQFSFLAYVFCNLYPGSIVIPRANNSALCIADGGRICHSAPGCAVDLSHIRVFHEIREPSTSLWALCRHTDIEPIFLRYALIQIMLGLNVLAIFI